MHITYLLSSCDDTLFKPLRRELRDCIIQVHNAESTGRGYVRALNPGATRRGSPYAVTF